MTGPAAMKIDDLVVKLLSKHLGDKLGHLEVGNFFFADDIVFVPVLAILEQEQDRLGNIASMDPKPAAGNGQAGVGVNIDLFPGEHCPYHLWYEFFVMLALAKYVHRVSDDHRRAVCVCPCETQLFAARL